MSIITKTIRLPIFWILILAFLLRLWGTWYGFPFFLVNDEPALVLGALKMLQLKTLIPALHQSEFKTVLYYPPLPSYFYALTLAPVIAVHYLISGHPPLVSYEAAITLNPTFIWVAARILNALMGLGVIWFMYLLTRKATGSQRAAIFTALFLALSFYEIQLSQVVRHWMPASLFIAAAWLVSWDIREKDGWKPYWLVGLFTGLGMSANTSAAIAFLPAAVFHLARRRESFRQKIFSAKFWSTVVIALALAAVFTALYPYGFTRAEGASSVGGDISMRFGFLAARSLGDWVSFLKIYWDLLFRYETFLLPAAFLGALFFVKYRRDWLFPLNVALFGIMYLTMLYLFFNPIPRALIFILPPLGVLAGYGMDQLLSKLEATFQSRSSYGFLLSSFVMLIFFAYPFIIDLRYDYLLGKKDTRLVARDWIEKNIPAGAKLVADLPYLRLTNTKSGIQNLARLDSSGLRSQDRVLLERDPAHYPSPSFYVFNIHFVSPSIRARLDLAPARLRAQGFRYVMVEYGYADRSDLEPDTRALVENLPLIKHFTPFRDRQFARSLDISGEIATILPTDLFHFSRFGKFVDIYEL